jgi:hypothetical protein
MGRFARPFLGGLTVTIVSVFVGSVLGITPRLDEAPTGELIYWFVGFAVVGALLGLIWVAARKILSR